MSEATESLLHDQSAIDRGDVPATTIPQLVSAVRQNFAGAGADLLTVRLLAEWYSYDSPDFTEALDRLADHIDRASAKANLAMNEAKR